MTRIIFLALRKHEKDPKCLFKHTIKLSLAMSQSLRLKIAFDLKLKIVVSWKNE